MTAEFDELIRMAEYPAMHDDYWKSFNIPPNLEFMLRYPHASLTIKDDGSVKRFNIEQHFTTGEQMSLQL